MLIPEITRPRQVQTAALKPRAESRPTPVEVLGSDRLRLQSSLPLKKGAGLVGGTLAVSLATGATGYITGRALGSELAGLLMLKAGLTRVGPLSGLAGGVAAGLTTRDPAKAALVGALAGSAVATALFKPCSTWTGALLAGAALGSVAGALGGYVSTQLR